MNDDQRLVQLLAISVNRFNALVRGILGAAVCGGDSQVRSHGNYAERCAVVVADMTRIAHELVGQCLAAQTAA